MVRSPLPRTKRDGPPKVGCPQHGGTGHVFHHAYGRQTEAPQHDEEQHAHGRATASLNLGVIGARFEHLLQRAFFVVTYTNAVDHPHVWNENIVHPTGEIVRGLVVIRWVEEPSFVPVLVKPKECRVTVSRAPLPHQQANTPLRGEGRHAGDGVKAVAMPNTTTSVLVGNGRLNDTPYVVHHSSRHVNKEGSYQTPIVSIGRLPFCHVTSMRDKQLGNTVWMPLVCFWMSSKVQVAATAVVWSFGQMPTSCMNAPTNSQNSSSPYSGQGLSGKKLEVVMPIGIVCTGFFLHTENGGLSKRPVFFLLTHM